MSAAKSATAAEAVMHPAGACDLCGLPAGSDPFTRKFDDVRREFCCLGCMNVYAILLESGVFAQGGDFRESDVYQQSLRLGLISNAAVATGPSSIPDTAERRESLYQVSGLWCSACGWLIEHALMKERGIENVEVLFTSDLLRVKYCPQYVETGRIVSRVESLGYQLTEYNGQPEREQHGGDMQNLLLRLGIAGALWMNVMLFSLVVYASYFEGIADWARRGIPFILMALSTPAIFYSGWPILRLGWLGLRQGTVRMETLISSGMLAAYGYSVWQAILGGQHYYFDTACAIVTLVLTGKALERGAKEKTARSVSLLYRLMPKKARLWIDGRERFVAIEAVQPGSTLLVKPGERIPVDAVMTSGSTSVDESVVTGESQPRPKLAGDTVVAGSLNGAGVLEIQATRIAADSTLAQIIRSVEASLSSRTPLERAVDRISRMFVPAVLLISALTLAGCLAAGLGSVEAMLRAIAVLVIACPCALGVATPLATTGAVGVASARGILIRDVRVLETIRGLDVLVLDKTGTATEGQFRVREASARDEHTIGWVAAVEAQSEHPLAQAIVRYAREREIDVPGATEVVVRPGLGIEGMTEGRSIVAGSRAWLQQHGVDIPAEFDAIAAEWERNALTVVFYAVNGGFAGGLALGDQLRAGVETLVRHLHSHGVRTILLSGDTVATTSAVAARLGADEFAGEVLPENKAQAVERYRKSGAVVAMVGDGINDAPALAAADLGIAMGSGTDLAMQAAPVVLMSTSLDRIAEIVELATLTHRVIRQNLFWAFAYNIAGIGLAIAGVLNPILAAGAMVLSSLSVIGNSLRLRKLASRYSVPDGAGN